MARMKAKDLKVTLGASAQTAAACANALRTPEGLISLLKKHGWTHNRQTCVWVCPDQFFYITDEAIVHRLSLAEETFQEWQRHHRGRGRSPLEMGTISGKALAEGTITAAKIDASMLDMMGVTACDGTTLLYAEPKTGKRYIKAEPDRPLDWLDRQVERICELGRI